MEKEMITTTAWKYFKTPEKITYCVQFDKVPKRWKTKVHRMLRGWKEFSIGFGSEYNTLVFKKDFKNSQDWLKWIQLLLILGVGAYIINLRKNCYAVPAGILLGAGLSNVYDRFIHEGVVDYIYYHHWFIGKSY